eukprot:TRINITY_DN7583_c0_g1_i1.p1 TRINITY_DN7583_c0_g1~~TRINITY_DN7583_c0_g1_i1.p1  ORF type:complete len:364 (+),score=61.39 TRINITY_DN7583_c0_g1_i1:235-1326(+)
MLAFRDIILLACIIQSIIAACVPTTPGTNTACNGGNASTDCLFACNCTDGSQKLSYTCRVTPDIPYFVQFDGSGTGKSPYTASINGQNVTVDLNKTTTIVAYASKAEQFSLSMAGEGKTGEFDGVMVAAPCNTNSLKAFAQRPNNGMVDLQVSTGTAVPGLNRSWLIEYVPSTTTAGWQTFGRLGMGDVVATKQLPLQCEPVRLRAKSSAPLANGSTIDCPVYSYLNKSIALAPSDPENFLVAAADMDLGTVTFSWLPVTNGGCEATYTLTWTIGNEPQKKLEGLSSDITRVTVGFSIQAYVDQSQSVSSSGVARGCRITCAPVYLPACRAIRNDHRRIIFLLSRATVRCCFCAATHFSALLL